MNYTSKQAGDILGVRKQKLVAWANKGFIKEANTEGGKHKHKEFTLEEIKRVNNLLTPNGNMPRAKKIKPAQDIVTNNEAPKMFPNSNLMNRLDRIESKLDAILNLWK